MPDVSVTVKGKDELSNILDDIERKAQKLGVATDRLSGFDTQTPTERKQSVSSTQNDILEKEKERIRKEHENQRRLNEEEFSRSRQELRDGEKTRTEFNKDKSRFDSAQSESRIDEENELKQVEKDSLLQLKLIARTLLDREKIDREQKQRENKEFTEARRNGFFGKMQTEKDELEKKMLTAPDEQSYKMHKKQLDALKAKMDVGNSEGGGNAMGLVTSLAAGSGTGVMMAMGVSAAVAALLAANLMAINKVEQSQSGLNTLNSFSLGGNSGKQRLKREWTDSPLIGMGMGGAFSTGVHGRYGIDDEEMAKSGLGLLSQSGRGDDLYRRTLRMRVAEKGTGIDNLSQYSGFDRQDKNGYDVTQYYTKMISILSSINGGSIKRDDLHLMGEKMQIGNQLSSYQFQRQDKVDRQQLISQMASAEMFFGASGRDNRAGDLVSGINQNAASGGGNQNLEWMKWMAARKSHPEMNDEELAGMMEVGLDQDYQKSYYGMYKNIAGKEGTYGSFMAKKAMLGGLTVDQRNQGLGKDGALLNDKYYNPLLTSQLNNKFAEGDTDLAKRTEASATANTPVLSKDWQLAKEIMQGIFADLPLKITQSISEMLNNNVVKVRDVSPKTDSNKTFTGQNRGGGGGSW